MRRTASLLLALLLAAAPADESATSRSAQAGGATVTVSIPSGEIRTGQPLVVEFLIDRPDAVGVRVPELRGTLGAWDVRKAESLPISQERPNRLVERITLATFESGEQRIPSIEFTLRDAEGRETTLASPELPVQVRSLLGPDADPTRIRDAKGAVDMPLEPVWFWYAGLAVLVGAMAALAWRWWSGRGRVSAPPEPPHARALRELEQLAALQLPQKGLVLDFYVRLSDTVRRYVEGRFAIRAPEQTTKEFLQAARHHPAIREDHQRMLAAFLRAADMVKFAAQRPGPAECDRGLEAAQGFVRESMPEQGALDAHESSSPSGAEAVR
ncbi:MAG: hypothetical protein EBQ99_03470 [Planctomycetes bacterium]|nr:hypothetical protein [Planctomycetota bacterium]